MGYYLEPGTLLLNIVWNIMLVTPMCLTRPERHAPNPAPDGAVNHLSGTRRNCNNFAPLHYLYLNNKCSFPFTMFHIWSQLVTDVR